MNIVLSITMFLIFNLSANPSIDEIETLYEEGRFMEARAELKEIKPDEKNMEAFFLYSALLEENGVKSINLLKKIVNKYPKSIFYNQAIYSIALYEFLQSNYKGVIPRLKRITTLPQRSKYYDASCFWIAASYEALKDTNDALIWYKKITDNDSLIFLSAKKEISGLSKTKKSIYSIQIGSFQSRESAKELLSLFKNKGYDSWLATTTKQGNKYYKVLIGKFESKDKANGFTQLFKEREGIPFWIVKIKIL